MYKLPKTQFTAESRSHAGACRIIGPVNGSCAPHRRFTGSIQLTTQHLTTQREDDMTTSRILIGLIALCGVALGFARDSKAAATRRCSTRRLSSCGSETLASSTAVPGCGRPGRLRT